MTSPNQILVALLDGKHTEGALADRLRLPILVIRAMLHRHERDGLTAESYIAGFALPIWSLTDSGRTTALTITPVTAQS